MYRYNKCVGSCWQSMRGYKEECVRIKTFLRQCCRNINDFRNKNKNSARTKVHASKICKKTKKYHSDMIAAEISSKPF